MHVEADIQTTHYTYTDTPVGKMLLIANENKLRGTYLTHQERFLTLSKTWIHDEQISCFRNFKQQLAEYFRGQRTQFEVDYIFEETPLQKATWSQLGRIPYGKRMSYKELAHATNFPHAVRAVATALGSNPLMLIPPCHRVVRNNGKLGGFAAGIGIKQQLLDLEQRTRKSIVTHDTR